METLPPALLTCLILSGSLPGCIVTIVDDQASDAGDADTSSGDGDPGDGDGDSGAGDGDGRG